MGGNKDKSIYKRERKQENKKKRKEIEKRERQDERGGIRERKTT